MIVNSHGADRAFGGAERYVEELRSALERAAIECTVLSAFPIGDGRRDGLGVLHASDWRDDPLRRAVDHAGSWVASSGRRLRAAIVAANPDVVHTHNLFGIATGIWGCAHELGIPVVHTVHDYGLLCPRTTLLRPDGAPCRPHPLLCGLRTRRLARWTPVVGAVIGVSRHVLSVHDGLFAKATTRHVIMAPLPEPGPPVRAPGPRLATLGFAGRLDVHKGVASLLTAVPRLAQLGVRVRVAGDGPLRAAVADHPLVEYHGRLSRAELVAFRSDCDAGLVGSEWQEPGVSFAALEWLGDGRPVLATARGGLAELPRPGVARIEAGPDGIVAAVGALANPDAWSRLCSDLRTPDADAVRADGDRFLHAHRLVYADVTGRRCR